jgi:UDP-N-acetylglucosamine 2-epimerase (hydrolysing)
MRFEYFLTLLKHAEFIMGNSSAGVREAPHFGIPAINLGSRQNNRVKCELVLDVAVEPEHIINALKKCREIPRNPQKMFGNGESDERFYAIIKSPSFWERETQKYFVDREIL